MIISKHFKLIIFIIASYCSVCSGVEYRKVIELNNGSCWFEESMDSVKFGHFSLKISGDLKKSTFTSNLKVLESIGVNSQFINESMESHFYCGANDAYVVFNLHESDHNLCVWMNLKNSKMRVLINPLNKKGLCLGARPGRLIVGLNRAVKMDEFRQLMKQASWPAVVEDIQEVNDHVALIVLHKEFHYDEVDILKKLNEDFGGEEINYIEYDFNNILLGESIKFDNLGLY